MNDFWKFLKAFSKTQIAWMSRGLTVILSGVSIYLNSLTAIYTFRMSAFVSFFAASFFVWRREYARAEALEVVILSRDNIEIIYNPEETEIDVTLKTNDEMCYIKALSFTVIVRNKSSLTTVRDITVRLDGPRDLLVHFFQSGRENILEFVWKLPDLNPGKSEAINLIGRTPISSASRGLSAMPLWSRAEFHILVDAADTTLCKAVFEYNPTKTRKLTRRLETN